VIRGFSLFHRVGDTQRTQAEYMYMKQLFESQADLLVACCGDVI